MKEGIYETIQSLKDFYSRKIRIKLILYSILTGMLTGAIVSSYTYLLKVSTLARNEMIKNSNNIFSFVGIILLFILIACFIQFTVNKYPLISGSGIPQVMGIVQNKFKFNWFPELVTKFISGLLAIFIGFSMGREGPSIHLGALVGDAINKVTKRTEVQRKYLITCGASAGLAAAFNAPLAGAIFAVEELHKFFSPVLLICIMMGTLFSNVVSKMILGTGLSFEKFTFVSPIVYDFKSILLHLFLIFLLSIIMVLGALAFNYYIIKFKDVYKKIKLSNYTKFSIVAIISLLVVIFLPEVTGGGHELVEKLFDSNMTIKFLLLLLIAKFFFLMLCYATGTPGGIFLPLLVVGALIGKIFGSVLVNNFGFSESYGTLFVLIAMTSYFTAVVRSPITGIVLILEMSGNFTNLFSLTMASTITYLISELLKQESVYEILYQKMIGNEEEDSISSKMVTFTIPVTADSRLSNKKVKDIKWPKNLLIVGIRRQNEEFIPNGETIVLDSDVLIFLTDENTAKIHQEKISELGLETYLNEN